MCPPGYNLVQNACIQTGSLVCPTGYILSGNNCITQTVTCPNSQYWNGLCCVGVPNIISCAAGYTYDGTTCVFTCTKSVVYNCSNGYAWNGVSCVQGNGQSCQQGQYWNGLLCVAIVVNVNTNTNTNVNVNVNVNVNGGQSGSSYPICTSGCYWHPPSGMCVSGSPSVGPSYCPPNTIWNGVGCSQTGGYNQCSSGKYWNGNICVSITIQMQTTCGTNQYWDGATCRGMAGVGVQSCSSGCYYFKPYSNCLRQF